MQKSNKFKITKYAKYLLLVYLVLWAICLFNYFATINSVFAAVSKSTASGDAKFSNTVAGEFAIRSYRECIAAKKGAGFLNTGYSAFSSDECKVFVVAAAKEKKGIAFSEEVNSLIVARLNHEDTIEDDTELMEKLRFISFALKLMTFGILGRW